MPSTLGFTVLLTGMSGAGKSTTAKLLDQRLRDAGARVELLDGDVIRTRLSKGLGYTRQDRNENLKRIAFVCELLSRNGIVAIVAAIAPYREAREEMRRRMENFVEVYLRCPLDVLIARDDKGLYKKALAGEISHFTGVSDPYEEPQHPDVTIDSSVEGPEEAVAKVWATLQRLGLVK